jgi:hypothetical protein
MSPPGVIARPRVAAALAIALGLQGARASAQQPKPEPAPQPDGATTPAAPEPAAAEQAAPAPEATPGPELPSPSHEAAPAAASPAPAPPAAPEPAPAAPVDSDTALVHIGSSYAGAWLELRSYVDEDPWRRVCQAPCDRRLRVSGMEARVSAPGMTTSNVFRIEGGRGTASLKVSGGSSTTRSAGIIGLLAGIPISMIGMGLFGYGSLEDDSGLRTAGGVTLAVGAVTVLASLPLLVIGTTNVRNEKGGLVAARGGGFAF